MIKDMVRMIEVNEPNSRPHPISCIFDFFWYLKLMINPDMVQQRKYEYY